MTNWIFRSLRQSTKSKKWIWILFSYFWYSRLFRVQWGIRGLVNINVGPVHDSWYKRNLSKWKIIKIESCNRITNRTAEWKSKKPYIDSKISSRIENFFQNLEKNFQGNIKIMQHEFVIVYGYLLRTKLGFQNDFLNSAPRLVVSSTNQRPFETLISKFQHNELLQECLKSPKIYKNCHIVLNIFWNYLYPK